MNRDKLFRDTLKLIKETNRRLSRLERGVDINKGKYNPKTKRFERKDSQVIINKAGKRTRIKTTKIMRFPSGTWASKKLYDRISSSYIKNNRVSINKGISLTELRLVNKALKNFLNSKTSTVKGILEVEKQTKQNISNLVDNFDEEELSNEDVNTLYDFFSDSDFQDVIQYIPPSDLYILLVDSKRNNDSNNDFLRKIEMYIDKDSLYSDSDMKDKLIRIYGKLSDSL